jgi:hypothetical protein
MMRVIVSLASVPWRLVGQSAWSDEAMLAKVRELAAPGFAAAQEAGAP